jgi:hypothetical protein
LPTIRPALLLEEGRADIVVRYEGEIYHGRAYGLLLS